MRTRAISLLTAAVVLGLGVATTTPAQYYPAYPVPVYYPQGTPGTYPMVLVQAPAAPPVETLPQPRPNIETLPQPRPNFEVPPQPRMNIETLPQPRPDGGTLPPPQERLRPQPQGTIPTEKPPPPDLNAWETIVPAAHHQAVREPFSIDPEEESAPDKPVWAEDVPMLGRADSNNRFNVFDNQTAKPRPRVWVGYQYLEGYNTGVRSRAPNDFLARSFSPRNVHLTRLGAELVAAPSDYFRDRFSLTLQTEYIASWDTPLPADSWANPLIMGKFAIFNEPGCVLSAVLGVQPQLKLSMYELREKATRVYPGMLFFKAFDCSTFVQGGLQFGLAGTRAATTCDYAVSFGHWLYRSARLDGDPVAVSCSYRPFLLGVVPQVEMLCKHVFANGEVNPFEIPLNPANPNGPPAPFQEPHNVVDLTFGTQLLFTNCLSVALGISFPVTAVEVRRTEFLTTVNFNF